MVCQMPSLDVAGAADPAAPVAGAKANISKQSKANEAAQMTAILI